MTPAIQTDATERFSARIDRALLDGLAARVLTEAPRAEEAVTLPFTNGLLGVVPRCTPADVGAAARRARSAQPAWAAVPARDRAAVLLRFHDLVLARREEILDLIQLESGKARRDALEEVLDTANVARYYGHVAPGLLRPRRRQGAFPLVTRAWEHHPPRGVAGFIAPWNYPLTLGITDALPALAAGNAVLIKPDLKTPFSALWAVALLEKARLPSGVAQVVTGEGAALGPRLIEEIDFLMFTGSTATGRIVARQAAGRLIESSMELGGKNAMIVLDDADLKRVVPGAVTACFSNSGQLCISIERLYVHERIYDVFVPRFVEATNALRLGTGLDDGSADMGSLVSRKQLDAVARHVDQAVALGARVLAGGRARPDIGPYFYEPTILENVTADMAVCGEETFGPVVSLCRVATEDEAIERANASPFGLNFSVWTRDTRRGRRIATRLQAGTVNINEGYGAAWGSMGAPMGGFKGSGLGRRHGEQGLLKYTEAQTVAVQRLLPIAAPPFMRQHTYERVMVLAMRVLKRLPWVQ
ncbi:MAG: succinate-semialdehyde dehydrogenase (NADP(+)) [Acidobacteria bacterium]|nr:succinate-semialdehyde dehydrogenase (NADP(+)) [Acidobacteriota bacterium]